MKRTTPTTTKKSNKLKLIFDSYIEIYFATVSKKMLFTIIGLFGVMITLGLDWQVPLPMLPTMPTLFPI